MNNLIEHSNDEIDLIELLRSLWDGKWVIAGVSAAALAIGSAWVALTPNNFDVSILIEPSETTNFTQFNPVNSFINQQTGSETTNFSQFNPVNSFINRQTGNETNLSDFVSPLSQEAFLIEFIEILVRGQSIERAADLIGTYVGVEIEQTEIFYPSLTNETNRIPVWRIKWVSDNKQESEAFISSVLSLTNETLRQRIVQRISDGLELFSQNNSRRRRVIQTEITNAMQDYQVKIADQIAYLSEQAALARQLGIEVQSKSPITVSSNEIINITAIENRPVFGDYIDRLTYSDGYRALEEQITIISSRERADAFVPNLRELQTNLRALEQDTTVDEFLQVLNETSLTDEDSFRSVYYDTSSIELKPQKRPMLTLTLSLVLGVIIGTLTVMMQNALADRAALKQPTRK